MGLIDDVRTACRRLVRHGWGELLAQHGLDIAADDLEGELRKELPSIDRRIPGFEDFASEGRRGIEPGQPARSLLYHAFASPNVVTGARGETLGDFPSLADIKVVENFVFGAEPPSLAELTSHFPEAPMAVAVFASEYRPGADTVHRKHADLCFSRTGVARVGTAEPLYDARARGFLSLIEGDDRVLRVLPAQYAPYIAVQLSGEEELFGPMNFNLRRRLGLPEPSPRSDDRTLDFWVPLHKLFSGPECIRGLDLSVTLEAHHVNEKIRRIHKELQRLGHDTGWQEPDLNRPPFIFFEDIAEFSRKPDIGVLTPVVHEKLVEPAVYRGNPLTYEVPPNPDNDWAPSLEISAVDDFFRHAPEYVHARHEVRPDETVRDLNDEENVAQLVREGKYRAYHYLDFTGDGWVKAACPELAVDFPRIVPAYSLVTSPDFYPMVKQRELIEWWTQRVPRALRERIWPGTDGARRPAPYALSDVRFAPNLELRGDRIPADLGIEGADFRPEDRTVTAIVSLPIQGQAQRPLDPSSRPDRHGHLPDAAASVFAPGWDTSLDIAEDRIWHLASYGLGSPFPEDSKLCAALSSFWPAVSPDSGRSFSRLFATVTPMTDEEIGSVGELPWDGVIGPRLLSGGNGTEVEYARFDYVDYVQSALGERFSLALTGKVTFAEYTARILAMARAYEALELASGDPDAQDWRILSFLSAASNDEELQDAQTQTGVLLQGTVYRIAFGRPAEMRPSPDDHRKARVKIAETAVLFVGVLPRILIKRAETPWQAIPTH